MEDTGKKGIIAIFGDDHQASEAIRLLVENKVEIGEVHTPFPSHSILHLLGKETRLPYFSVIAGGLTILSVLAFLYYVAVIDYPINFGGKPYFSFPSFVVVIYLCTILFTFILTVMAFQGRTKLFPGKPTLITHEEASDDKFVVFIPTPATGSEMDTPWITRVLKEHGALEINETETGLA